MESGKFRRLKVVLLQCNGIMARGNEKKKKKKKYKKEVGCASGSGAGSGGGGEGQWFESERNRSGIEGPEVDSGRTASQEVKEEVANKSPVSLPFTLFDLVLIDFNSIKLAMSQKN